MLSNSVLAGANPSIGQRRSPRDPSLLGPALVSPFASSAPFCGSSGGGGSGSGGQTPRRAHRLRAAFAPSCALLLGLLVYYTCLATGGVLRQAHLPSSSGDSIDAGGPQVSQQGPARRSALERPLRNSSLQQGGDSGAAAAIDEENGASEGAAEGAPAEGAAPSRPRRELPEWEGAVGAATGSWVAAAAEFKRCRGPDPDEAVPQLHLVRTWLSARARQRESITLVTQLNFDRLDVLAVACSVWPDPVAAVVYAPTVGGRIVARQGPAKSLSGEGVGAAEARLAAFHKRREGKGACTMDVQLYTQNFEDEDEALAHYPFNAARNRALELASTEVVLLLDADFVPAAGWLAQYKDPAEYSRLLARLAAPAALVLPAFETQTASLKEGQRLALRAAKGGKPALLEECQRGTLQAFHITSFPAGHNITDYARWEVATDPYSVQTSLESKYEPYILLSKNFTPFYDERFQGYGNDKVQHLAHLAALGVQYWVHPEGFVVHTPHSRAAVFWATRRTGQRWKLKGMFLEVKEEILQRRFRPVVASPEQCGGGNVPSIGAGGDEGAQSGGQAISLGASMAEAGPSAEE